MGEKFEKLKSDLETGDASGIEDTFHQGYLYLKENKSGKHRKTCRVHENTIWKEYKCYQP